MDTLVGGLYGVRLGNVFFGESMFSRERDASKAALARLVEYVCATASWSSTASCPRATCKAWAAGRSPGRSFRYCVRMPRHAVHAP